jgi:hypothetical protein
MPAARRRTDRDPREVLVRLVDRLGRRRQFVTLADIEQAAQRSPRLTQEGLADLVEGAVAESILLKDLRTFYDRASDTVADAWVYRVNPRHPFAAALLE